MSSSAWCWRCFIWLRCRGRGYILLAASYFFYGTWNLRHFIPLLLTLTAIDYTAGRLIEQTEPNRRKLFLILSLGANLGFLGFFKYYNFLASNVSVLSGHPANAFALNVVLPLGISFHTFQSMSYIIDVYRGEQRAIRDPIDYALFICFFPQLVAGPIVRAREFFRDLFHWQAPTADDVSRGLFLMAVGLAKKMAFADQFAKIANEYFNHLPSHPGAAPAWSGVFAFGMQIYFDFAGYTDMAIGMAKLSRVSFPGKLPAAVSCCQHYGFLAALAHVALALAARLPLYTVGGEPPRRPANLSQPYAYDAAGRAVARRQLELRDLGRIPRRGLLADGS